MTIILHRHTIIADWKSVCRTFLLGTFVVKFHKILDYSLWKSQPIAYRGYLESFLLYMQTVVGQNVTIWRMTAA